MSLFSFGVSDRAGLKARVGWLDELGTRHAGVIGTDSPQIEPEAEIEEASSRLSLDVYDTEPQPETVG
jgi:hypothetical protein